MTKIHFFQIGISLRSTENLISRILVIHFLEPIVKYLTKLKNCSADDVILNAYAFFLFFNKNFYPHIAESDNIAEKAQYRQNLIGKKHSAILPV